MCVESGARTLRGRADAVDERGVVIEFKMHVNKTALRQLACYLAMMTTSGPNGPTKGPTNGPTNGPLGAVGYVVGLHDAVVHKVTVRDPLPIIAANRKHRAAFSPRPPRYHRLRVGLAFHLAPTFLSSVYSRKGKWAPRM